MWASGNHRSFRGLAAVVVLSGTAALVVASTDPRPGYVDDSFRSLLTARKVVRLEGPQGFKRVTFTPPIGAGDVALDAREATFLVANSRNPNPTVAQDCEHGAQPVNRYPLLIEQQRHTAIVGGLFLSRVPQGSDWQFTYCNSAAISFQGAPNGIVDGTRIAGAWDAIRAGRGSPGLLIVNSWISDARDDAIENDFLQPVAIRDTLIDGAFQGVSAKPRKDSPAGDASDQLFDLSGVLLRLKEYPYKSRQRFGALMKGEWRSPRLRIVNSVVAVDYAGGQTYPQYWMTTEIKITSSSNNLFLWLSDAPIPDSMPLPPPSFSVLVGQAARDAWARARDNWINCHPELARLPTDRRSNRVACTPHTWGGFTN